MTPKKNCLQKAGFHNKTNTVLYMIEHGVDPTVGRHCLLRYATKHNNYKLVGALLKDGRVDPVCFKNAPLKTAIANGYIPNIILLLKDGRVNPAPFQYQIFQLMRGDVEHVKFLLTHDKIDPTFYDNYLIRRASPLI